jgi:hypothetical protein
MYTQLCILKLVTCVHTYRQNLESMYVRCVLLYTHSSMLKIVKFTAIRHQVEEKHGMCTHITHANKPVVYFLLPYKNDQFSDRKYCSVGKIHLQINQFLCKQITMQMTRICVKPAATSYGRIILKTISRLKDSSSGVCGPLIQVYKITGYMYVHYS